MGIQCRGNAKRDWLSVFGTSAGWFDGTGDYVSSANSTDWNLGSTNTIDCWVKFYAASTMGIINARNSANGWYWNYNGTAVTVHDGTTSGSYTWTPIVNTWYHLATCNTGGALKIYVNGIGNTVTGTFSDFNNDSQALAIGSQQNDGTSGFNGQIDEVRVSKGSARYSANFVPPTVEYSTGAVS